MADAMPTARPSDSRPRAPRTRWTGALATAMGIVALLAAAACQPVPTDPPSPTLPLSTAGGRIVDAEGRTVVLEGVAWFGIETETHAPHGLWARDYRSMLAQIADAGFDTIRLPFSVESLRASSTSGINTSLGANAELAGASPLEVMDAVTDEAGRQGLLVLLDAHRLDSTRIPELWYGDGYTEADWIDTWTMLAARYRDRPWVIGADLKNEPHGAATWGTGDPATDWRLAAERAGDAIGAVNPDWLIVVEGVEGPVAGQQLSGHWWGGNLEAVHDHPVRLAVPNKLVYSVHEYGPGVYDQTWFHDPDVEATLAHRWAVGFDWLVDQDIAPVLVGELGGREVGLDTVEGRWQNQLVDHLAATGISWTYWSWNPNSTDTGGVLLDDWQTLDLDKMTMLLRLLAPGPGTTTTTTASTAAASSAATSTTP